MSVILHVHLSAGNEMMWSVQLFVIEDVNAQEVIIEISEIAQPVSERIYCLVQFSDNNAS